MSDLFCAATVVFARHADAEYVDRCFSDEGGTLTTAGREQAVALADALATRRVAKVCCSDSSRAVQTAQIAAGRLGVTLMARKALREIHIGDLLGTPFDVARLREVTDHWAEGDLAATFPGGESGVDVVDRYRDQLGEIADQHRGETVLVVGHESAACVALSAIADNVHPPYGDDLRHLRNGETVELMIDADGVRLLRWGEARFPVTSG
ncbi:MAG: histidine phosphatase family protein [Marmoricola sp.]